MATLYIICPETGKPVDTGVNIPKEDVKNLDRARNTVTCPHCGQTHTWDKTDVRFDTQEAS